MGRKCRIPDPRNIIEERERSNENKNLKKQGLYLPNK